MISDHRTIIRGYGKMHVQLNKDGRKEVLRAYAAYVPGFHTNLISPKILREKLDVCFDQRSEELQMGPKRELFSKLQHKLGMYCIEYNPVHALVTGSNFPSHPKTELKRDGKQKTSTVPKLTIGTKALWQSRLGHPSDEAIRHLSNTSTGVKITDAEITKPKPGDRLMTTDRLLIIVLYTFINTFGFGITAMRIHKIIKCRVNTSWTRVRMVYRRGGFCRITKRPLRTPNVRSITLRRDA